jgi:hypothetical protein
MHRLGLAGLVALISVVGFVVPAAASSKPPDRFSVSRSNSDVVDCGTFKDHYTDFLTGRGSTSFNQLGAPISLVIHWEHHSDDTNSVSGLTLHEHGHYTERIDLLSGTDTITGNEEIATRPGTGVVVQDVGRVVYDANGEIVFFAGGRKHSEVLLGEQVLCEALA